MQHGGPGLRQVAQQDVDLLLRADVDPARRVEAQHRPDAPGDPPCDRDLLLVPAGEPADLACGARVDLQPPDCVVDHPTLAAEVDQPPVPERARPSAARCSRGPTAA